MLKIFDLVIKWWFEIIVIVTFYRNIASIIDFHDKTNRIINSFEIFTNRIYNYAHIQRIKEIKKVLNIKSQIDWKKFKNRIKFMMLIEYNKKYVYRMIDFNDKIKRVFNISWLKHKRFAFTFASVSKLSENYFELSQQKFNKLFSFSNFRAQSQYFKIFVFNN